MTTTKLNLLNPLIMQEIDDGGDENEKNDGLKLDEEESEESENEEEKAGGKEDENDYIE